MGNSNSTDAICKFAHDHPFDDIRKGDLIEFERTGFNHWAVYAGDDDSDPWVIHVNAAPGQNKSHSLVQLARLKDVIKGSRWKVNNRLDLDTPKYPAEEIVARAKSKIGEWDYSVRTHNCEHFATWCRYGFEISEQVFDRLEDIGHLDLLGVLTRNFLE